MIFAGSSSVDIFAASHVAAPQAMLSADVSSVDRPAASHVAAQQGAEWLPSSVFNKHIPFSFSPPSPPPTPTLPPFAVALLYSYSPSPPPFAAVLPPSSSPSSPHLMPWRFRLCIPFYIPVPEWPHFSESTEFRG